MGGPLLQSQAFWAKYGQLLEDDAHPRQFICVVGFVGIVGGVGTLVGALVGATE